MRKGASKFHISPEGGVAISGRPTTSTWTAIFSTVQYGMLLMQEIWGVSIDGIITRGQIQTSKFRNVELLSLPYCIGNRESDGAKFQ